MILEAIKMTQELEQEIAELKWQLGEANDTIEAIRTGQVDALIVKEEAGHQLYTLRSADQTYRVFIENMTGGAVTLNSSGLILYSNSRFSSMLGLPLSKVIGVPFAEFITEKYRNTFDQLLKKGWQVESKGEIFLSKQDQTSLPVLLSLTTLELNEGVALSIIITDLSVQKETEKQKDEFISMASHELKTPVTTLKAFTQLLLFNMQKDNNIKATDFLLRMDKQINKLTILITDLLDATKVNAGVLHFERDEFELNELIIEVVNEMQLTSETHVIELKLGKSQSLIGDRNRVGQVISNLISNAIKYSPTANRILVSSESAGSSVIVQVQDFGIGIPEDQKSRLFSRFFRASEIKSNTFPGLGLGLYISNEIIKRHSGSITFKSEIGKGSVFSVELPMEVRV